LFFLGLIFIKNIFVGSNFYIQKLVGIIFLQIFTCHY
jgi:hypothetical protein